MTPPPAARCPLGAPYVLQHAAGVTRCEARRTAGSQPVARVLATQEEWDETMRVGDEIHVVGFGTIVDPDEDQLLTTDDVGHKRIMSTPIDSFSRSGLEFRAGGEGQGGQRPGGEVVQQLHRLVSRPL